MNPIQTPPRLADYFLSLAGDAALMADQQRDPRATMSGAGLTDEQIDAVLAGPVRVRDRLDEELAADPARRRLIVRPRMTVHTPTPDDDEPPPPESDRS